MSKLKLLISLIAIVILTFLCIGCDTDKKETKKDYTVTVSKASEANLSEYKKHTETSSKKTTANEPSSITKSIPSSERSTSESTTTKSKQNSVETYIVNTNTKKFHRSDCISAANISDKNKAVSNNRNALLKDGYSPCGSCNP